jgi:DNA-binding GntR family transcriptional regulator
MSEANKRFHIAIGNAGRNPYLASFYERLLEQGQRMLHLHFEFLERSQAPGCRRTDGRHQRRDHRGDGLLAERPVVGQVIMSPRSA